MKIELVTILIGALSYTATAQSAVSLVEIDPGHFHAALVLNRDYPEVAKEVQVFAPEGDDVNAHAALVEGFNGRKVSPTHWHENIYRGKDFLEKFRDWAQSTSVNPADTLVVLAGRNDLKANYYLEAVKAGCNVLSDKPMMIDAATYMKFLEASALAGKKGLLFDDIMTERYEITTILQRELVADEALYGEQEKGTQENPAVTKISVHHFCKLVDGKPLRRPSWYYDTRKQGEAIVDVTTHLVDLVQWELFPEGVLTTNDVQMLRARTWATPISARDYELSTGLDYWPKYLKGDVDKANILQCKANGEFDYTLQGVHVRIGVVWNFQPPKGGGDTHHSVMRGTKASIEIRQNAETGYKPYLFVVSRGDTMQTQKALLAALSRLDKASPGVGCEATGKVGEWRITYPNEWNNGHEAHFSQVVRAHLDSLTKGGMTAAQRQDLLVKYYTLYKAWEMSRTAAK